MINFTVQVTAHVLAYIRRYPGERIGHSKHWKEICIEIGARPERCYGKDVIVPDMP